jgi:FeS assembly SUF system regulator
LTDYATVLLAAMAAEPTALHRAAELAERARLESSTVAKLLKQLTRAGLLESVRGAAGGYRLARPPERVSIADVIEAMDGPIAMTQCALHDGSCRREEHCLVRSNWRKIALAVESALRAVSLLDMIAPPRHWQPRVSVERAEVRPQAVAREGVQP